MKSLYITRQLIVKFVKRKTQQFILFVYFDFNNDFELLKKLYFFFIITNYSLSYVHTYIFFYGCLDIFYKLIRYKYVI